MSGEMDVLYSHAMFVPVYLPCQCIVFGTYCRVLWHHFKRCQWVLWWKVVDVKSIYIRIRTTGGYP